MELWIVYGLVLALILIWLMAIAMVWKSEEDDGG
jgi:hypothetical protein